jgi:hypothetical protein
MLRATDSAAAPWMVARAYDKNAARLAVIADMLTRIDYHHATRQKVDDTIICRFDEICFTNGMLAQ